LPRPVLRVFGRIGLCRLIEQRLHFPLELVLGVAHPRIAHRLVLRGGGLHLGAVQRHVAQFHQPRGLAQPQALDEQPGQRRQVALAERGNAVVVGMLVTGQHADGDIAIGGALDLSRRPQARAVRIEQHRHHHGRVIGRLAPPVARLIRTVDGG